MPLQKRRVPKMKVSAPGLGDAATEFTPVPPGRYQVKIADVELRDTKDKKSQYLSFELEITDGEHKGRKLFTNCSLKERALWNLKRLIEAANIPYEDNSFNTEDCLGAVLDVEVEHEQAQDGQGNLRTDGDGNPVMRENVSNYFEATGAPF